MGSHRFLWQYTHLYFSHHLHHYNSHCTHRRKAAAYRELQQRLERKEMLSKTAQKLEMQKVGAVCATIMRDDFYLHVVENNGVQEP